MSCLISFLVLTEVLLPSSHIASCFTFTGQYVGATIIIVSLSCCMTVLTLNVHHKGKDGRPVPGWLFTVAVRWLGWLLCVTSKPQTVYKNGLSTKVIMHRLSVQHFFPPTLSRFLTLEVLVTTIDAVGHF